MVALIKENQRHFYFFYRDEADAAVEAVLRHAEDERYIVSEFDAERLTEAIRAKSGDI